MYSEFNTVSCLLIFLNKICDLNASLLVGNDSFTSYCKIPNLKPWIYFPYDVCLHVIVNEYRYPSICMTKLIDGLTADGVVIYQNSLTHLKSRSISNLKKTKCESYLFVMENPQVWFDEMQNQPINQTSKIFYPFSRLYFLSLYADEFRRFDNLTKYLHRNALFGYQFTFDAIGQVIAIRDVVNNFTRHSSPNSTDLTHPLLDTNNRNKEFKVSAFDCPPHIIYVDKLGSR